EQHALGAFEQDALAGQAGLVERHPDGRRKLQHEVRDLAEVALEPGAVDRRLAESGAQRVVMGAEAIELRPQTAEMGEVADPDGASANLVLIGRADTAAGGADLALAAGIL